MEMEMEILNLIDRERPNWPAWRTLRLLRYLIKRKNLVPHYERVHFKLIALPCCGHLLCWVNPRYPTYCPQCGERVFPHVKQHVMHSDENAVITWSHE